MRSPPCQVPVWSRTCARAEFGCLAARQPGVSGSARNQLSPYRLGHQARLDDRVLAAQQSSGERAAQGRVELSDIARSKQLIAPVTGVGPGSRPLEHGQFGVVSRQGQRSVRPESGTRNLARDLLPELPGAQRQGQFGTGSRPLTQISPKLRTLAPRGPGSRSRWITS